MNKWVITIFNHPIQTNPFKLPKYDSGSNFRKEQRYTFLKKTLTTNDADQTNEVPTFQMLTEKHFE